MSPSQLLSDVFPAWAYISGIYSPSVILQDTDGKGLGLKTTKPIHTSKPLIAVPRELVLSSEAVKEFAKVDQNFKQLLETAEHGVCNCSVRPVPCAHLY